MSDYRIQDARSRFLIIFITLFATPLTGAGIDIYVPSLPMLAHYFHAPQYLVQLSLTIYLIGYGLFNLIGGPLADAWGRRKLLTWSTLLGAISAIVVALAPNIYMLLLVRFIQGAALAGLGVVVRATFPDTFSGKTLQKMTPFMMTTWALGPILAPYLGAYLQHWFNWQANFYFLAGYSFVVFLLSFLLPETLQFQHSLKLKVIVNNYLSIFTSRLFLGWVGMTVLFYSFLVVFAVIGPFLVEDIMHFSPVFYGRVALSMGVIWFMGSLIARLLASFHPARVLPKLSSLSLVIGLIVVMVALLIHLSIITLLSSTLILTLLAAIMFGITYGSSLSLFPKMGGTNSGAAGTLISMSTGIISSLSVILKTNSDIPLLITFFSFFIIASIIYFLIIKPQLHGMES